MRSTKESKMLYYRLYFLLIIETVTCAIPTLTITLNNTAEDTPLGTLIGTVVAKHTDDNEVLTIETVPGTGTSALVNISEPSGDSKTGVSVNVILAEKLDRDYDPATRSLYFKVTDLQKNEVTRRATLFILDVNDRPPTFEGLPYRITVYENEMIMNRSLFTISTKDPDEGLGGIATYSLTDKSNLGNPFSLSGNEIWLSKPLNYSLNTFYQLQVNAQDMKEPFNNATPAELIVTVLDVQNTPPYYLHLPYTASIEENTEIGSHVLTVTALDGDRGVPNSIEYSFLEGEEHNFTINGTTGEISVNGDLDADAKEATENGGVFRITVNASEIMNDGQNNYGRTWTTTTVSVTIIDLNDNIPRFERTLYQATIAENSPKGVPLTMLDGQLIEVFDLDQNPDHNSFKLMIVDDNEYLDAIETIPAIGTTIYSRSTILLKVNNSALLDFETRTNITVKLTAMDLSSKNSSQTTVIIQIQDVNDNSPTFSKDHKTRFEVYEGAKNGTFIAQMTATDLESGVTYSLDDNDENTFYINKTTGNLTVFGELNRETISSSYTLFVVATDIDDDQQRSTTLRIKVIILDVNDNAPEFVDIPSQRRIPEDTKPGTELFKIRAVDKDSGKNQEIEYFLTESSNITGLYIDIDAGTVIVNGSLIGMVGLRYLTVMARDKGEPPLNTTANIAVIVTDVNIHRPIFYKPSYLDYNITENIIPEISVYEEMPFSSEIYLLYANDSDSGENGAVSYKLVPDPSNHWQNFFVDRLSGNLTNARQLDRETQETFRITVSAADDGFPSLESTIELKIILIDIDDNEPIFKDNIPQPHLMNVTEELSNVVIGSIDLATDADSEPNICYYILGGELVDHFLLNRTTGMLYLVRKLDREELAVLNLVILASGECDNDIKPTESNGGDFIPPDRDNKTLLWVKISVLDINDQPPVFSSKKITSGFLYDIEFGTVIKELREDVTDADIGENAVTYFKLLEPIKTKDMDLDTTNPPLTMNRNGTVKTNMLFSSDMTGAFIMEVEAYDIGNLTDKATIEIYLISDIQRVKLVFMKTPDEVRATKEELIKELQEVLKYRLIIDKIATHQAEDGVPVITKTDMFIHARYLDTDKVVPAQELWRAFDFSTNINLILDKFGVVQTVPVQQIKQESVTTEEALKKSLIIVTVSLAIIVVILILVLANLRSRYKRRLRAANTKTFGSAKDTIPDLIPPGTNKYFAAASNPVYMKDVNINLGEDSVSCNSLDLNEVGDKYAKGISFEPEEQEVVMSLYDERAQEVKDANRNPALDMVLQQYEEVLKFKKTGDELATKEENIYDSVNIEDLEQTDI